MKAIYERRSIRKYTDQKVSKETIEILLKAAMAAPSANNDQPWHFIVIDDKNVLKEITKIQPYSGCVMGAACAIIVCGDVNLKAYKQYKDFWVLDCSAATENILIEAQDLGLGAVWMGIYPVEEWITGITDLFKLPDNIIPLSLLSIGYPAEKAQAVDRFKASRVHSNKW